MLKFKDFVKSIDNSIVFEARVSEHPDWIYVINPTYQHKCPEELIEFTFINAVTSPNSIKEITQNATNVFYSVTDKVIKKINNNEAIKLLGDNKNSLMKTESETNIYLVVSFKTNMLTQLKGSNETTTNVKEGMVVYFYYSDINSAPNQNNFRQIIGHLINKVAPKIPTETLDPKSMDEITKYLSSLQLNKRSLDDLIDFWSSADLIKNRLGGNSYTISRNTIFNDIRKLGSKLSGFPADKWCPGDIYLIDPSMIKEIPKFLTDLSKNVQPDTLTRLNSLFRSEFENKITEEDPLIGSIIAISLKKEQAMGGKAKQFLKSLTQDEKEYNVTKEELEMNDKDLINDIEKYRAIISDSCKKSVTTINLLQDTGYTGDTSLLKKKFASIKLAHKLLSNPDSIDDNLLKSTAFGMSLTGINPTFFKVIGSSKGIAKDEKYNAGEMIELMDSGLNNPNSTITIIDRNSNASVIFQLKVKKGEEDPKEIQISCKPNGNTQATLEIEKSK